MQALEILDRIHNGEDSTTQFKQDVTDANRLAEEMVAFSNAQGGLLLIGVNDDGTVNDVYFTKSGSDKRKMSPEELRRLFAESERLFADEEALLRTDITDLNSEAFYAFMDADNHDAYEELKQGKLELATVLQNLELLRNGHLTLAGNLIFGKTPQRFSPSFYVDCVYFDGNDVSADSFINKLTVKGSLRQQYESSMQFLRVNLRQVPIETGFNAQTRLEIDEAVLGELLVNALVHRDYYIQSSVKVFVFYNRLEIISPGKLPNSLTVERIKQGLSVHRNPILNSICRRVLPYSGYGSGIKRVVKLNPAVMFVDDRDKEEFRCVIPRK